MTPPSTPRPLPRRAALAVILILAAVLYGWALGSLGWGNSYYSAAVKSMGQSWTNFLFGAYDPAGVITVDKPPAALWPQVLSTKIFGLHGWAMILPQVLEGIATVFLLHRTVRLWAGEAAGLLAALVLTLTPITVAINRDNNPDTLLVLTLVAAAYALTRAMRTTSGLRWLCAAGFLIGLGFMTKMLAAWMVIPAFAAAWLVGARGPWLGRLGKLLIGGVVLVVSSLWWIAMVALWPGSRPYIGGSTDGSAWDLVIGYNGLGRIFGGEGGFSISFGGAAGLGRLFNDQVGGQISWLLPLCGVALALALAVAVLRWRGVTMPGEPLAAAGWVLWGTWLVVCGLVFATQKGTFHPYYTTQLAPAVAAVTAGFATTLARAHRAGARWALPLGAGAVAVTTAWAYVVIARVPSWNGWVAWLVGAAGVAGIVLLLLSGRRRLLPAGRPQLLPAAVGVAVLAVLSGPAAWAISVPGSTSAMGGANPTAGPPTMPFGGGASGGGTAPGGFELPEGMQLPPGMKLPEGMELPQGMQPPGGNGGMPSGFSGGFPGGGAELTSDQRKILDYAVKQSGSARIKLATEGGAMFASAFILNSDATVIGMGGFIGIDDAPSVQQLKDWTSSGQLRFVLGSGWGGFGAMMGGASTHRSQWLKENCGEVPAATYGGSPTAPSSPMMGGGTTLYDCAAKH
ncbi:glycosyltransferase family 39 protein [Nonomuraea sp. NPDC049158]|uniref:ArnT family glycosyltransferase n=1 Tax=Nonomuraea sp. NPDC049158 TaxID=3155649 RepID=UPI0033CABB1B